jgi:hypothetical protein
MADPASNELTAPFREAVEAPRVALHVRDEADDDAPGDLQIDAP